MWLFNQGRPVLLRELGKKALLSKEKQIVVHRALRIKKIYIDIIFPFYRKIQWIFYKKGFREELKVGL